MIEKLKKDLQNLADPEKTRIHHRFFKTGKGEYGEGDVFLGIPVPQLRVVAKKYKTLSLNNLRNLLNSKIHQYRQVALYILVDQFEKEKEESQKKKIATFYLQNMKGVNNWDLVDLSAPKILGGYLLNKDRQVLYKLARSKNLWEKRIAILSTLAFIREEQFDDTLKISEILLDDDHDLIHKAVGWMLREAGKKDLSVLKKFLDRHVSEMPRTMLRYSIEKLSEKQRQAYLIK